MLKKERQQKIIALVNENSYMNILGLAENLDVSAMTIRRDLTELSKENRIIKLYGGAQKIKRELSTQEKIHSHIEEKKHIGTVMNSLIRENTTIFLGPGTTVLHALHNFKRDNLFIVTNSLLAFNYLIHNTSYRVLLTGGEFSRNTEEFYGENAEKSLNNLNIDIAFCATNGIFENNVTTANPLEGSIQQAVFDRSKIKCIVADNSKFNRSDVYTFTPLTAIDYLITDPCITDEIFHHYNSYATILKEVIP